MITNKAKLFFVLSVTFMINFIIISCNGDDDFIDTDQIEGAETESSQTESNQKVIKSFDIADVTGTIDESTKTITLIINENDLTSLTPNIQVSPNATISPASGVVQDFTKPVTYIVTAENGSTVNYQITVKKTKTNDASITGFTISGIDGTIDELTETITLSIDVVNLASLVPNIKISTNATISPASGVMQDFTSPVTYKVTAENGLVKEYVVTVTSNSEPAESKLVNYNYQIAHCVGAKESTAWIGESIVIMIEGETSSDRNAQIMNRAIDLLQQVDDKYQEFTGLRNLRKASEHEGKTVIEIVKDNCGSGGLASHGVLGMSTGVSFFDNLYNNIAMGSNAIPQVFLYEINRNYWLPKFNKKIDWAMNEEPANYGWWTVGMNNAQAVILTASINTELDYFGQNRDGFRNRMVQNFTTYLNSSSYDFDYGWKQSLMPWNSTESINDLMSGLLIYSYENFGGDLWMKNFYKYIKDSSIPNRSGVFAYQECRDNVYKIWSLSAERDLIDFFENDMKWEISDAAKNDIKNSL
ncbi:DUF5018 domain-containing protein [Aquimarina algicola]|uniref:DUF5018 domain-containing protein n=1 Tax=Aquimarina algicola TaxID=2589995 RepID=A0A504J5V9_9FLAO|nr:DUF5018 domain-containing protein [Aquimarina algicola]TPN86177.1 DUF5018 domain-containing protein [Aquimarina algicola]